MPLPPCPPPHPAALRWARITRSALHLRSLPRRAARLDSPSTTRRLYPNPSAAAGEAAPRPAPPRLASPAPAAAAAACGCPATAPGPVRDSPAEARAPKARRAAGLPPASLLLFPPPASRLSAGSRRARRCRPPLPPAASVATGRRRAPVLATASRGRAVGRGKRGEGRGVRRRLPSGTGERRGAGYGRAPCRPLHGWGRRGTQPGRWFAGGG